MTSRNSSSSRTSAELSRRQLLVALGAVSVAGCAPARLLREVEPRFTHDPFALGVASGYSTSNGTVLWTRLLDRERRAFTGHAAIPVRWEVASDASMRRVVQRGVQVASPEFAHSLHIEVSGLQPGRDYWYRFTAGGMQSEIGRTRTASAPSDALTRLRLGVASCQKYENGYYVAYRYMANDDLDMIVHVGDYIYEYASTVEGSAVRGDGSGETRTLDDYRARYALYKSDADLRAAHAACPWLLTWDDHEVANDYFGDASYEQSGTDFLARRAAAYRAYYEHMPLPRAALPVGSHMRLYAQRAFGDLLNVYMLDSRQYRWPLACREQDGGASCAELWNESRAKLGSEQEAWLRQGLASNRSQWNLLAQGTPMAHVDQDPGPGMSYRRDGWDGYPAARQRLLDALVQTKASNPVVLDGDIHAFQVANLNARANDLSTPVIASELTTTSITSGGIGQRNLDSRRSANPNILFADATKRGYTVLDVDRERLRADLVTVESIRSPNAARGVTASFVVESGRPGPIKVGAS